MKTLSLFFLQLGPLANANRLTCQRDDRMPLSLSLSLELLENFTKFIADRLPGKLSAKVPAFRASRELSILIAVLFS